MSSTTYRDNAETILVRCARHCCVCRRFRPNLIQVHHIVERSAGGTDDLDNLIAVCVTCHFDIHSKVPFVQRFTATELKQRRDCTFALVEEGRLVPAEDLQPASSIVHRAYELKRAPTNLSEEMATVLATIAEKGGRAIYSEHMGGWSIMLGNDHVPLGRDEHREAKRYESIFRALLGAGLLQETGYTDHAIVCEITDLGYATADDILASGG